MEEEEGEKEERGYDRGEQASESGRMSRSTHARRSERGQAARGEYNRKERSLSLLCEHFLELYGDGSCSAVCLDQAASQLAVERRRIYDIVNVLESLEIVSRQVKNRYQWNGLLRVPSALARLRQEACQSPLVASFLSSRGQCPLPESQLHNSADGVLTSSSNSRKEKSLGLLSQYFLQIFLAAAPSAVSLEEGAKCMLGANADAGKIKTKTRRLYDIANILTSLRFIEKTHVYGNSKRPAFRWLGTERELTSDVLSQRGRSVVWFISFSKKREVLESQQSRHRKKQPANSTPEGVRADAGHSISGNFATANTVDADPSLSAGLPPKHDHGQQQHPEAQIQQQPLNEGVADDAIGKIAGKRPMQPTTSADRAFVADMQLSAKAACTDSQLQLQSQSQQVHHPQASTSVTSAFSAAEPSHPRTLLPSNMPSAANTQPSVELLGSAQPGGRATPSTNAASTGQPCEELVQIIQQQHEHQTPTPQVEGGGIFHPMPMSVTGRPFSGGRNTPSGANNLQQHEHHDRYPRQQQAPTPAQPQPQQPPSRSGIASINAFTPSSSLPAQQTALAAMHAAYNSNTAPGSLLGNVMPCPESGPRRPESNEPTQLSDVPQGDLMRQTPSPFQVVNSPVPWMQLPSTGADEIEGRISQPQQHDYVILERSKHVDVDEERRSAEPPLRAPIPQHPKVNQLCLCDVSL